MNFRNTLKFLLPFSLWCYLYRSFLWGTSYLSEDSFYIYAGLKYFLANIKVGVFPHWNPYVEWGMGHICMSGEYNPIWLLTLALNLGGVDYYHAFMWTLVLYLWFGIIGFYLLLRHILQEKFLAYLGAVLLLFTGFGMTVFTQLTYLLVFVPALLMT